MSHKHGADLGGIRNLERLRLRCVCSGDGCWHFRTARGRPMERGKRHAVWISGVGQLSATKAAWQLKTGKPVPPGHVVSRICESYDCVRPGHLRCWTKADEGAFLRETGRARSVKRTIAARSEKRRNLVVVASVWELASQAAMRRAA